MGVCAYILQATCTSLAALQTFWCLAAAFSPAPDHLHVDRESFGCLVEVVLVVEFYDWQYELSWVAFLRLRGLKSARLLKTKGNITKRCQFCSLIKWLLTFCTYGQGKLTYSHYMSSAWTYYVMQEGCNK